MHDRLTGQALSDSTVPLMTKIEIFFVNVAMRAAERDVQVQG